MVSKFKNPLDNIFDINENISDEQFTEIPSAIVEPVDVTPEKDEKDEEDIATDAKFDEIYTQALGTFQNQMAYTEIIEPRFAARNAEVAASYLNIALQAASIKAKAKLDRKKVSGVKNDKAGSNTLICTREEILKMISVDADTKEI